MTKRLLDQDIKTDELNHRLTGTFHLRFSDPSGATAVLHVLASTTVGEVLANLREVLNHNALSLFLDVDYDVHWTLADLIQEHQFDVKAITRVIVHPLPSLQRGFVEVDDPNHYVEGVWRIRMDPVEFDDTHSRLFVPHNPDYAVRVSVNPDTHQWQFENYMEDIDEADEPEPRVTALYTYSQPLRCTTTFKVVFEIDTGIVWLQNDPLCIGLGKEGDAADTFSVDQWADRKVISEEDFAEFDRSDAFKAGITAIDVQFANESVHLKLLCRYDEVQRRLTVRHLHRPSIQQFSSSELHPCVIVGVTPANVRDNGDSLITSMRIEEVTDEEAAVFDLSIEEQTRRYKQARAAEVRDCVTRQVQIEVDRVLK